MNDKLNQDEPNHAMHDEPNHIMHDPRHTTYDNPNSKTLLDAFLHIARNPLTAEFPAVECAAESWTYGDLDCISTGLALQLKATHDLHPLVAVVSENHPYILAMLLAAWKVGGAVALLDQNAPRELMETMLRNIEPTCLVLLEGDKGTREVGESLSISTIPFVPAHTTITALTQQYLALSPALPASTYPPPRESDVALYIHTSSATSASNLKCVPLTHRSVLAGGRARVGAWPKLFPELGEGGFERLRVLGWAPWAHVMAHSHDLVAGTWLTGGCYVFGVTPSTYHHAGGIGELGRKKSIQGGGGGGGGTSTQQLDVAGRLLQTVLEKRPTVFCGVPWILEGFMQHWLSAGEGSVSREQITTALRAFRMFGSGGAGTSTECVEWAREVGLRLVLNMGMTELGGPLFHAIPDGSPGWPMKECLLADGELLLVGKDGQRSGSEGELVVKSAVISSGYLKHDSSAFTTHADGTISFRTGDIYEITKDERLLWKGRTEDYIQMSSGETLDPRVVEAALNKCPSITHSCVVGNNFLKAPSQFVCAIVELTPEAAVARVPAISDVTRALAAVNRTLAPPLRIPWARVLILEGEQRVPYTNKGMVFRKKLEDVFGVQVRRLLIRSADATQGSAGLPLNGGSIRSQPSSQRTREDVRAVIIGVVSDVIGIGAEELEANVEAPFAELGMDSAMAVSIVNLLNARFDLRLPLNACHTYIDLVALCAAVRTDLGLIELPAINVPPTSESAPIPKLAFCQEKDEVVIVGQALRLPGDINTPEAFWKALIDRRDDLLTHVPPNRWDHESFYRAPESTVPPRTGDINFEKAGFIDIEHFDNAFFRISSAEAFYVSPTIRLTLETAFEALENANIPVSTVKGTNMGVFVAAGLDDGYSQLLFLDQGYEAYTRFYGTGIANSAACGRLSYLLDVHGPSVTVDTACSAGLVAFHQAVQYLESGEGESAIVCGVNTHTWPGSFGFLCAQKMSSVNSRCATFTNEADGYVPAEGAVALVLKTRKAAIRDGDTILGIVKATDVRHDGGSQGFVALNVKAQIAMQRCLLQKSNLNPSQIDLIETHGTGTPLGDLIEMQGISEVFRSSHSSARPLFIGAAKTCFGHTENASGLVGVIKTLASLQNESVPGLVHLNDKNMNPSIDVDTIPLCIPHKTRAFQPDAVSQTPLRAIVLANGFAGTLAGLVLEKPNPVEDPESRTLLAEDISSQESVLFLVSAKTADALLQYLRVYLDFCSRAPESDFRDICFTSCICREHYKYRFACAITCMADLMERLRVRISSPIPRLSSRRTRVMWAFPGQGTQYKGMASHLIKCFPSFEVIINDMVHKATKLTGYSILPFLLDGDPDAGSSDAIVHSEFAQICIFVYQCAIARWLENIGLECNAVLGHSLGEIAASVVAGALSFDFALQFVIVRARLLRPEPSFPGAMAAISASEDYISDDIDALHLNREVTIAVYNSTNSHVVSGERVAVETLLDAVKSKGIKATMLNIDQGNSCIDHALPALRAWLEEHQNQFAHAKIPFFSTALGNEVPRTECLDSQYWLHHARNPVLFKEAASQVLKQDSIGIILDCGPQPTIWSSLQTAEFSAKNVIPVTGKRGKDQGLAFLTAMANLFEDGVTPNFVTLFKGKRKYAKTRIPTYPFQKRTHYPAFIPSRELSSLSETLTAPKFVLSVTSHHFSVDQPLLDLLRDHLIEGRRIVPGAALADFFARECSYKAIQSIHFHQPLVLETLGTQIHGESNPQGVFSLFTDGKHGRTKICSGSFGGEALPASNHFVCEDSSYILLNHEQVYESFRNVYFGPLFRNIRHIKVWDDHADAVITVNALPSPHDRIRKLDACLHMFGAIAQKQVPQLTSLEGSFLPTSLEDFSLHTDDLPSSFVCRYHFPLIVERNHHVISASFEVLSHEGKLLASCKKYKVAWIPAGVAVQDNASPVSHLVWMQAPWKESTLSASELQHESFNFGELLYLGIGSRAHSLLSPLSALACKTFAVEIKPNSREVDCTEIAPDSIGYRSLSLGEHFGGLLERFTGSKQIVMIDFTSADTQPNDSAFSWICEQILMFMKLLISSHIRLSNLVVLSSMSAPLFIDRHHAQRVDLVSETKLSGLGAVVQGMIRVYRRETGLDNKVVWGLDLPDHRSILDEEVQEIVLGELIARNHGSCKDAFTAYRRKIEGVGFVRLCPELQHTSERILKAKDYSGNTAIIGMGSIGKELGAALVSAGGDNVIFIGRREPNADSVVRELSLLEKRQGRPDHFSYVCADVCDDVALRAAFLSIQSRFGPIHHIFHTAAIVKDATISKLDRLSFRDVLQPKIVGALNLHILSKELALPLRSFVLLSSMSVSLGNPGQVAYVGANAFLDSLASYRHACGLPATSLQLGAWESKIIEHLDFNDFLVSPVRQKEGIPVILEAISIPVPIQVIADVDMQKLASISTFAQDPFFAGILPEIDTKTNFEERVDSKSNVYDMLIDILRTVLELKPTEQLDLEESLSSYGVDSISFAQIRGRVSKEMHVDIPMVFLSDTFSIADMIQKIAENISSV